MACTVMRPSIGMTIDYWAVVWVLLTYMAVTKSDLKSVRLYPDCV